MSEEIVTRLEYLLRKVEKVLKKEDTTISEAGAIGAILLGTLLPMQTQEKADDFANKLEEFMNQFKEKIC